MNRPPQGHCGYTWSKEDEIDDTHHQNCCWRETTDGAEYCVWHADTETDSKSIEDLHETRTPPEIRDQSSINIFARTLTEALDGAKLADIDIGNEISFEQVALREADLSGANLWKADFSNADLKGTDLTRAIMGRKVGGTTSGANLSGVNLAHANLSRANLKGSDLSDGSLRNANLSGANLWKADLSGAGLADVDLSEAYLERSDLSGAYLGGSDLSGANFNETDLSDANLEGADLSGASFRKADLSGANLKNTTCHNADFEEAILSRATLFDADFRGAKLHGTVLGDVRINGDTEFLGAPVEGGVRSPHTRAAIFAKSCCVYDSNYSGESDEVNDDKAKSVYQALEELASRTAQSRLQSEAFVRRQDIQKNTYKTALLNGPRLASDEASHEGVASERETSDSQVSRRSKFHSLEVRVIAGMRYLRSKTARVTLLYGESPWRIIGWSVGFIFAVALVYPLNEWLKPVSGEPITYSRIVEDPTLLIDLLYFSTLIFTTLGMGDYEPLGWGQAIATLSTAFGTVLIALLVFVLGRRAAR